MSQSAALDSLMDKTDSEPNAPVPLAAALGGSVFKEPPANEPLAGGTRAQVTLTDEDG